MTHAPLSQQRLLIDLQNLDSRLARLSHERTHLPILERIETVVRRLHTNRRDTAVATGALTAARAEADRAEVSQVARRAEVLRERLAAGTASARDLAAIQGEIDQLGRRQADLEDKQIAAMETLESAQSEVDRLAVQEQEIRAAGRELTTERDAEFTRLDEEIEQARDRRRRLAATIDATLLAEYEAARAVTGGIGALALYGRRVEGGTVEISPAEHARIAAAPADAVIHAEENDVILVRMEQ